MITIIDYGAGNLFSVQNALNFLGVENNISSKVEDIISADKLILPGVGAFPDAMKMLDEAGLTEVIKEQAKKKALMGICLGMQMLFDKSYEFGETEGLGLIPGTVELMHPANNLVIPHIGWNSLEKNEPCKLLESVNDGDYVYCTLLCGCDRQQECCGILRLRYESACACYERQCVRLSVPPGKER